MKINKLFNEIIKLNVNAEIVSFFSYEINPDKRFKMIQIFDVPSVEVVRLCLDYNCKIVANILNRKNHSNGDKFEQVVTYDVFPKKLDEIDFE